MENFRKALAFISLLILFSCSPAKKENTITAPVAKDQVINLHFASEANRKNVSISLAFLDFYGNRVQHDYDLSNGKQHDLKIESKAPIFLKDLSFKQTFYLLYPNENLDVKLDSNGLLSFKTLNKDSIRDNELNFFNAYDKIQSNSKKIMIKSIEKFPRIIQVLSPRKVESFLEYLLIERQDAQQGIDYSLQKYKDHVAYLEEYSQNHPISNIYKDHLLNFFKYEDLKLRLSIITNNLLKSKKTSLEKHIPEIINNLNCDSCLYLPGYKEVIQIYVKYRYSRIKEVDLSILYQDLKGLFSGTTADFVLFTLVKQALMQGNTEYKDILNRFKIECKTPSYLTYLQEFDKVKDIIPSDNIILMQTDGKLIDLAKVLTESIGKVVLLDFWASWCQPCKAQMPYSEKLKEKYKDQEVKFIYLSLDEQKSAWKVSNKQLNLLSSYLIVDNFKSNLSKALAIKTIPRYVLIDRSGKISNKDAARPSDKRLAKEIDALLLKK